MLAQLIPSDGSGPINVTKNITIVGRKQGLCDLVIDHPSISKLHCAIARTDGLLFIRDLGSTNGTKVNGQRVSRGALIPGDEVTFAGVTYRVHLGPGDSGVHEMERTEQLSLYDAEPLPDDSSDPDSSPGDSDILPVMIPVDGDLAPRQIPLADSDSDVRLLPED